MPTPARKVPRGKSRQRASKAVPINWTHPPCTGCRGEVIRRVDEPKTDWRRRKTCSWECAYQRGDSDQVLSSRLRWAAAIAAHPPCVVCHKPITKKSSPKENIQRFAERATCSPVCRKIHHAKSCEGERLQSRPLRKGELVSVDFAGGFGGRQTVLVRSDPRPLPALPALGSYMSASSGWLL